MNSRREFLKKAAYAAPVVLSLKAVPSFANTGSSRTTTSSEYPFAGLSGECNSGSSITGDSFFDRSRHGLCGE